MKDKNDIGGKVEKTGDGITGYNVGSNHGPGFVTEHALKIVGGIVIAIIVLTIVFAIFNAVE